MMKLVVQNQSEWSVLNQFLYCVKEKEDVTYTQREK